MPAKKNIIKSLRQEIETLEAELTGQRQHMAYREKQFLRIQAEYDRTIFAIDRATNHVANILKFKFNKDLAWLALTDNSESKFRHVKEAISSLREIAGGGRHNDA